MTLNSDRQHHHALAIGFANVGHAFTHLVIILFASAVLYLPGVFALPYGELLSLSSVGLVLFGVAALPAGWLGDRWSQVGMLVVFFFGIAIGAAVVGLAEDTHQLFIGLTLLGLFASIYHPVGTAWLVACAKRRGMTLGINGLFGSIGSATAPVFVGAMIDLVSWRAAFLVPAILSGIVGGALLYAWTRGWVTDMRGDRAPRPDAEPGAMKRVFVILTVTMACNGFVYSGMTNTMPKLFESGLGSGLATSYTEIGLFVGAVLGLSSLSSLLGGWLADRYSARNIYIVFWLAMVVPLFVLTSMFGVPLLAVAFLAMTFNVGFAAAENMVLAEYTPFAWRSLAYGAKFVLALGVGGLTVHLAGQTFDATGGFDLVYALFGAAALLAAGAASTLPRERPEAAFVAAE